MLANRNRQRGQALVGVLVIMTLVFAFAGALAVAASGLLRDQETAFRPFTNDKLVRSTVAAAVAQAAAAGNCSLTTLPAALTDYVAAPYALPQCQPIAPLGDHPALVTPFGGTNTPIVSCQGRFLCTGVAALTFLPPGQAKAWLWFATRGRAVAWVGGDAGDVDSPSNQACQGSNGPPNLNAWPPSTVTNGIQVTQVALQLLSAQSGKMVCFTADTQFPVGLRHDDDHLESASQQVLNLIVPVGTGALEEVDLWQSGSGTRLQWEESL